MKKWYREVSHAYMDLKPEIGYRLFESEEKAKEYAAHMQKNWTEGTTQIEGPVTQREVIDYVESNHITLDPATRANIYDHPEYFI